MARYTDSQCRLCRREAMKLYLKGDRCYSDKCAIERRNYPPGQHGQGRGKLSDYGLQLREKQKIKRMYGLVEKQFKSYFKEADRQKGVTGTNFLVLLERRLDNTVYRLGFAVNRAQARLLVTHGHFTVNGRRTDVPSMLLREGDTVAVREGSRGLEYFKTLSELVEARTSPSWVNRDTKQLFGSIQRLPERAEIDGFLNEQLIVEYYSR